MPTPSSEQPNDQLWARQRQQLEICESVRDGTDPSGWLGYDPQSGVAPVEVTPANAQSIQQELHQIFGETHPGFGARIMLGQIATNTNEYPNPRADTFYKARSFYQANVGFGDVLLYPNGYESVRFYDLTDEPEVGVAERTGNTFGQKDLENGLVMREVISRAIDSTLRRQQDREKWQQLSESAEFRNDTSQIAKGLSKGDVEPLREAARRDAQRDAAESVARAGEISLDFPQAHEAAEAKFKKDLEDFLNPDLELTFNQQFDTVAAFMEKLGFTIPQLTSGELLKILDTLRAHPSHRIIPTPLLNTWERQDVVVAAERELVQPDFKDNAVCEPLWNAGYEGYYAKLLNTSKPVKSFLRRYDAIRYKTPDGELVDRKAYKEALLKAGQAVEDESGTVWVFPVMDVGAKSFSPNKPAAKGKKKPAVKDYYEGIDATDTPESLIFVQLMHYANGSSTWNSSIDLANEASYLVRKDGQLRGKKPKPIQVTGIRWSVTGQSINQRGLTDIVTKSDAYMDLGVRESTSGL